MTFRKRMNRLIGTGRLERCIDRCRRPIVVHQDAIARTFEVVKLAAFGGPPEQRANRECQQHAERNQQDQDFHGQSIAPRRISRSELATTASELNAMPIAAAAGEIRPLTASGMAIRL